jgi:hypothetical protein
MPDFHALAYGRALPRIAWPRQHGFWNTARFGAGLTRMLWIDRLTTLGTRLASEPHWVL